MSCLKHKASFSAYILGKNLPKFGAKVHFATTKSTTNFGLPFCFFPFPFFFCLEMAKICCFCLPKGRQKARPPPELFKARPVQFGALPAAAEQLFTKPWSRPKIEPNFEALSWLFL